MQPVLREGTWRARDGLWVRGQIFREDRSLALHELSALLGRCIVNGSVDLSLLKILASSLRGFFAIIWSRPGTTVVMTDIVRSYPLFFILDGRSFIVSDRLPVSTQLDLDTCSILEFALTGFVSGPETMWKNTFQVQAGEVVVLNHDVCKIDRVSYGSFVPLHPRPVKGVHDARDLVQILDDVLCQAVERLVHHLNGRMAVIPLSGGWDSRTILLHLKRYGYPRIIAFGYGKEGNEESTVAAEVARQLGVKWIFIPYRAEDWRRFAETGEYWDYIRYAHNGTSASHIQDLLAIRYMVQMGILMSGDSVLVPGHSGDFVAGSHLLREYDRIRNPKELIQALVEKHYNLIKPQVLGEYVRRFIDPRELQGASNDVYEKLRRQLQQYYEEFHFVDPYAVLDFWNWRERQAKFIVNSVRVYEFYGLDFWLPLWDQDFVNFWQWVPLRWRLDRNLFRVYLDGLQMKLRLTMPLSANDWKKPLKRILNRTGASNILRKAREQMKRRSVDSEYYWHPLQWYGIWNETDFRRLARRMGVIENVNTLVVLDVLRELYQREGA